MENNHKEYLECERHWVFALLIFVGGFYGVYTYLLRGGVFCNAQTANFVLFAIELGNFHWSKAAYYLIPMTAYMAGAFVSEAVSIKLTRVKFLRWETVLVAIEILFIIVLGFIPDSAPFQIYLLDAIQHLPAGGRYPDGNHLLHQPCAPGGHPSALLFDQTGPYLPQTLDAPPGDAGDVCARRGHRCVCLSLDGRKSHLGNRRCWCCSSVCCAPT